MNERKLFEREIVLLFSYRVAFDLYENGSYKDRMINSHWLLWQRARNIECVWTTK